MVNTQHIRSVSFFSTAFLIKLLLLMCILLALSLPWLVHYTAGMTLNAYDLAEWTTLTPAQRQTNPPLQAALLIRAQIPLFMTLCALVFQRHRLMIGVLILGILAQLPPLEFFTQLNDINYQQQYLLAIASGISVGVGIYAAKYSVLKNAMIAIVCILGIASTVAGTQLALVILEQFQMDVVVGLGQWITILVYLVGLGLSVRSLIRLMRESTQESA